MKTPAARIGLSFGAGKSWIDLSSNHPCTYSRICYIAIQSWNLLILDVFSYFHKVLSYSALMFQNQYNLIRWWKSLMAYTVLIWLFLSLIEIAHAQTSQNASSTGNTVSSESPSKDDTTVIYGRGLSPDILATSVPYSSIHKPDQKGQVPERKGLVLRSSHRNVTGIGGYPLFALPIMSSDLAEIFSKTQADLDARDGNAPTSSYHVNTSDWSFSVITSNSTLHIAAVRSVLMHFRKLASTMADPQEIVRTRVGVLMNGSTPVADIVILPYRPVSNNSDIPFTNFGNHGSSTSRPNEVFHVTPYGSTCANQVVNETTTLAPYLHHDPTAKQNNLVKTRDLQREIMAPLGQTIYRIGYRLWRDPVYGIPVLVKAWALRGIILVALQLLTIQLGKELMDPIPPSEVGIMPSPFRLGGRNQTTNATLDTGYYPVGRLMARFVIQTMDSFEPAEPLGAILKLNYVFLKALARPMEDINAQDDTFAIEGEIYGPPSNKTNPGNGTRGGKGDQVVAKWQLSVRDAAEL